MKHLSALNRQKKNDRCTSAAPFLSDTHGPLLVSHSSCRFLSQLSLPLCQAFPLPCGERARALPFHLFLSCSINLSVQPDAGRASCIPNTKNNHFSVTGMVVVVGMVVPGRGAGMDGGGCGGVGRVRGKLLQLAGTRFNCSYSTRGGVMEEREVGKKKTIFFLYFCENTQHAKCRVCAVANKKSSFPR